MNDLIEALKIFAEYMADDVHYPTNCSHDLLYVACHTAPDDMALVDSARLDELGFFWNTEHEAWQSHRFGSC